MRSCIFHSDDRHGYVVLPPASVSQVDQVFGCGLGFLGYGNLGDLPFSDVAEQAIGAEHNHVTDRQPSGEDVHRHFAFEPQATQDDIASGMDLGLLLGDRTFLDQAGYHAVIAGDALDASPPHQVSPTVAHVGYHQLIAADGSGHQGGAHPEQTQLLSGVLEEVSVGHGDGSGQTPTEIGFPGSIVLVEDLLYRISAGHLAHSPATGSIGYHVEPAVFGQLSGPAGLEETDIIFIMAAPAALVSLLASLDRPLYFHLSVPILNSAPNASPVYRLPHKRITEFYAHPIRHEPIRLLKGT